MMNLFPSVIAHRGARAYAPENTLSAFAHAQALGCQWVELDVRFSSCHTPIVLHDSSLNRTTNGNGFVHECCWDELQFLDAGSWFHPQFATERIPTLQQTLAFLNAHQMGVNIEIKNDIPWPKSCLEKLLSMIHAYPRMPVLISSFSFEVLQIVRELDPQIPLAWLWETWEENPQPRIQELNLISINLDDPLCESSRIQTLKQYVPHVLVFTVNDLARAEELWEWGVDSVFSDVPDLLLQQRKTSNF